MAMAISRTNGRIADINVTPMADVMIVLLIIFMVTIPIINDGPVRHLPEAANTKREDTGPIVISIESDATVSVGGKSLASEALAAALRQAFSASTNRLVHVRADARLSYSAVLQGLDVCRAAGAQEIAFIATPRTRS